MLRLLLSSALLLTACKASVPLPEATAAEAVKIATTPAPKTGMVAAANPLATEAGLKVLREGGSAIDAAIDVPWTRKMLPDAEDEFFALPADIAAECFHVAHQPRSTWTFDALIRPFGEVW